MADKSSHTQATTPHSSISIWPVIIAPLTAGVYYLSVRTAFSKSVIPVMGRTDLFEIPRWGTHWPYRLTAEVISLAIALFVTSAVARGRGKAAAITGGLTISVGFALKLAISFTYPDTIAVPEPWYQYAIDAGMIFLAPIIASFIVEITSDEMQKNKVGVASINRAHFLWLWIALYFYALGMITPIARIYFHSEPNLITTAVLLLINAIPAAAFIIPAAYGLALLSGAHGNTMHPAGRSFIGFLVLLAGFFVGAMVQYAWYFLVQSIYNLIFS
jgi:hypothetical protein